jgi:diguanylate cyclase (GGDEF)-like protein
LRTAIESDLRRIERRDSYSWFLALGLLVILGCAIVVLHATTVGEFHSEDSRSTVLRALSALLFLVPLFCLYTLHVRFANRTMKSLLVEMNSVAASSTEVDNFLFSIAHKIAAACSGNLCQIALLSGERPALGLRSASVGKRLGWQPPMGKTYPLEELPVCSRVVETLRPVVLGRSEVARLTVGGPERELFTGGSKDIVPILVVPMAVEDMRMGVVILGGPKGFPARRFRSSTSVIAQTLAAHAATAIYHSTLKKEAIHDPLTNLYNRRHFSEWLKRELARANRGGHTLAILLCDLDHFKAMNDTLGHQVGDEVLKSVARSIRESTRGTDLVFRWGGDEIVVLLSESTGEGSLIAAKRIREGVLATGQAVGLDVDVSIGIALYPAHGHDEEELVRVADRALYSAKKSGDRVQVGEHRLGLDVVRVVFQPVVDVSTNGILGYEALTRDSEGKLTVSQLFEKYRDVGMLGELKRSILARQIQLAHEIGLPRVFVNSDFEVLTEFDPIPRPADLDVVVELSELEALNDLEGHLGSAWRWRERGYRFALDDFGAGFISLPFLAMLVPEYIKVDRSTMRQAVSSDKFRRFLGSLVHALRSYASSGIIAEGIETEEELRLAQGLGISLVQGFLFGRPQELKGPMSPGDLPRVLESPIGAQSPVGLQRSRDQAMRS